MRTINNFSRRGFLRQSFGAGAFVLGARILPAPAMAALESAVFHPNVFVGVKSDGTVLIVASRSEMGTSSKTSVPLILADEMEADWKRVKIEQAIGDARYGSQDTDGSCSVRDLHGALNEVKPTGYTTVPTAAMKTGDFTGLMTVNANGQVVQAPIYDPDSPDPNHPNQFQSNGVLNVIPSDRISTVSQALLQYLPSPNATGTGPGNLANNYYYNVNVPAHLNRWGASIDEHINARHSINVAFDDSRTTFYSDYQGAPIFGGASNSTNPLSGLYAESWPGGFVYGNYVWSVKPNVIFTAGVSIPFDYRHTLGGLEPKTTIAPQQLAGAPALAFPTVNFGGIAAPTGWGIGSGRGGEVLKTPYFAAYANTNWTVARHTLNFGVQGMYYKNYGWACSGCVGTFTFSGNTTDNSISSTGNFTPNPYAGSPFASFLIGVTTTADER